jgi:cystathionine beta-lyase
MPAFDFDRIIERRGGDSIKWLKYAPRDILPMWVADMDFASPPAVMAALHQRVDHGVFGYAQPWPSLVEAVVDHLASEYDWCIDPQWLVWLPGLVTGLNVACRAVGSAGDAVFSATPVYPPFLSAPGHTQRRLITAPLQLAGQRWRWNFDAVRAALTADTKLFLLCHPHNPVGLVWNAEELGELADIALEHDLVVCSDEIHCGLILEPGLRHVPFAVARPEIAQRSITLMAPSKTFNVPGLGCAFAVIPHAPLRSAFREAMEGIVPDANLLGLVAAEAAFRHGAAWHEALISVLRRNRDRVAQVLAGLPGLSSTLVEATYLAWIAVDPQPGDLRSPAQRFEAAGLGLSAGADFGGAAYGNFVRLNFACPLPTLEIALQRIADAFPGPG